MDELELLQKLRAMGVKMADLHFDGQTKKVHVVAVEFFPRELLDIDSVVPGVPDTMPTERPPAPVLGEDGPPNVAPRIPKAMAAILKKGSVS